jgi:hyperosmotically inducible periplasmic protein
LKKIYSVIMTVALIVAVAALMLFGLPAYATKADDNFIESSAKKSYMFKTYLKNDDIKIQSTDGAVSLTGTVSEESHKQMAEDTLTYEPGVKSVDNRLEVKGVGPDAKSDVWLSTKVKTMLLFHRNVSAMTEVETKDGIVTLKGDATSPAQRDLTTEYARDIEGVKDVKNEMTLSTIQKKTPETMGEKIDDASITSLVKVTLLYHRSTSAIKTTVTTKRGVVTLSGKAGNAAEKDLVTKFVNDVKGVKSVKNLMTIG